MKFRRVPTEKKAVIYATWFIGMSTGLSLPIIFLILYICLHFPSTSFPMVESIIIVYRMSAMIILLIWFWYVFCIVENLTKIYIRGFDMWMWEKYSVNYVFIFEFDARKHYRWQHMLEVTPEFCYH